LFLRVIGELYACRLYGIDPDAVRLAHAARELGGRARLAAASAGSLPFPENTFDKVILAEVLEHVPEQDAVLREVRRVLRPGGVAAITVPNANYPFWWDPVNRCRERLGRPPIRRGFFGGIWTDHLRLYRRDEIMDRVRGSGLVVTESTSFVRHCVPFAHNLVYGLGKWAVHSGLAPGADRFAIARRPPSPLSPVRWAIGIVRVIDRRNRHLPDEIEPSVSIALKAVKAD
jgi:SAM-dependent methyltransferase